MAKLNFFGQKAQGEQDDDDPGKAVEARFKGIEDSQKAANDTLKAVADSIKAMTDRQAKEDAEREKAAKAEDERKAAAARKAAADAKRTPEEEAEALLTDPAAYIREQNQPAIKIALATAARQMRDETLSDAEYYHGDFKKKVDALIASSSDLALQANPQYIMNCYKIIKADHIEDITKGELKTKAAMTGFPGAGGSGKKPEGDEKVTVSYEDNGIYGAGKAAFAAKQMGLKDEDVIDAAKKRVITGLEIIN